MRVVIVGAGIAGLTLAQRLEQRGWEVCLVERARGPRTQGYMLDFMGTGYDAAEAMGILPRLKRLAYPVDQVAYVDRNGRRRARIDYRPFARILKGRLLDIMRPDLESALREQLTDRVDLRFGLSVSAVDNSRTRVQITLTDGARLDADLLIGADGINSAVRELVFGEEEQFFRYLGFHTAAYVFEDAEISRRLGGRFCLTDSTGRLMGLYGLRDGRVATFCVHRTPDATLPADRRTALQQIYPSLGWVVPRALAKCPPDTELYYDQVAQVEVPEWSRGRVALIGDACQAVSLLAGQGASLAVAGAYILAEHLASSHSIESALARYEQVWRPVITEKQRVARRGTEWFLPRTTAQLWARRMMFAAGSLPFVDRFLGAELIGKSNLRLSDLTQQIPVVAGDSTTRALITWSPSPIVRGLLKFPTLLYRLQLGWLLGHRFMQLTHRGRTSGRVYRTVLEVVHYDRHTKETVVCSGWGTRADWYRNLIAHQPIAETYRWSWTACSPGLNALFAEHFGDQRVYRGRLRACDDAGRRLRDEPRYSECTQPGPEKVAAVLNCWASPPLSREHGLVFGATYASPAIDADPTSPVDVADAITDYIPSARPGTRAAHVWLEQAGRKVSTLDLFTSAFRMLAGPRGRAWCESAGAPFGVGGAGTARPPLPELLRLAQQIRDRGGVLPARCV